MPVNWRRLAGRVRANKANAFVEVAELAVNSQPNTRESACNLLRLLGENVRADCLWKCAEKLLRFIGERRQGAEEALDALPRRTFHGRARDLAAVRGVKLALLRPLLAIALEVPDCEEYVLHAAARKGLLSVCQGMVEQGFSATVDNEEGQTPEQVAEASHYREVAAFLRAAAQRQLEREREAAQRRQEAAQRRQDAMTSQRVGRGEALEAALRDERAISEVKWYRVFLLTGGAACLGISHSVLVVTVGEGDAAFRYLIEKTKDAGGALNGVLVSIPSANVAPQQQLLHTLHSRMVKPRITMGALRLVAVESGPYDLGSNNCHDAALAMYNHCAQPHYAVGDRPDDDLLKLYRALPEGLQRTALRGIEAVSSCTESTSEDSCVLQ